MTKLMPMFSTLLNVIFSRFATRCGGTRNSPQICDSVNLRDSMNCVSWALRLIGFQFRPISRIIGL
ncbi:hypothetical protein D3C76_1615350 [compost metagenome]